MQPTAAYCKSLVRVEWRASSRDRAAERRNPDLGADNKQQEWQAGAAAARSRARLSGMSTPTLFHRGPVLCRHDAAGAGRRDGSAVAEGSPRFPTSAIAAYPPEPLTRIRRRARQAGQSLSAARPFSKRLSSCIGRRPPESHTVCSQKASPLAAPGAAGNANPLQWQASRQMTDNGLWEQPRGRARAADRRQ
jgi:hypothetical protein